MNIRVAIAGAGLAGLTLGRILQRNGFDVRVYERDASISSRYAGYRVHINSSGTTALHAALDPDQWDAFIAASGQPDDSMKLFDEHMNPGPLRDNKQSAGIGAPTSTIPEHLAVCRSTIRQLLNSGLQDQVSFSRRVIGYEDTPDQPIFVIFDDGSREECDVLVAAEGINSAVRAQRLPDMKVIDLESRHIAAKVPLTDENVAKLPELLFCLFALAKNADKDGLTFGPLLRSDISHASIASLTPELQQEVQSNYALSIFNSTTVRMIPDEELFSLSGAELKEYAIGRMQSWDPGLVEVVRLWDEETVQALALRSCVPTNPWEPSRVTMIGDSVHAMSSSLGIGANTALRDAHELGKRLIAASRGAQTLIEAIGDYEEVMREYAFDAVRSSARVGEFIIGHRGLPG